MKVLIILLSLGILVAQAAEPVHYKNGYWYQNGTFRPMDWYVKDGILVESVQEPVAEVVDLAGGYVIPPYAEAHNHNLQSPWLAENFAPAYHQKGIFYGAMLCGNHGTAGKTRQTLEDSALVDVVLAGACISSSDGHPLRMAINSRRTDGYEPNPEDLYDRSYIVIDSPDEIEQKWELIKSGSDDLVKIMLVHHELNERRNNPEFFGVNGLTPETVKALVPFLQERGRRVAAHTESAADFALAVAAGVDWIAHLPGYTWWEGRTAADYRLSDQAIALAAKKNIAVIPTAGVVALMGSQPPERQQAIAALQRDNLQRLRNAGVTLLTGSDRFDADVLSEVDYLVKLDMFTRLELLDMLVRITPQALFPKRHIGRLTTGYEASFLVLEGNPLVDFKHLKNIRSRVKKGIRTVVP
ncbi:hypothetical protein IDSA_07235 [Pseudidiomarina salinarum]|uniref:Amidohydrolase-related domain-containing protein n=1 Tax=Pseudidiomarina salinarum TaxID=435908 RepID=A0A094L7X3_9GAMM|nr:hypothetical protein [Pseudidiomarina salinarum]KFZ30863.1 hypothetical protein IDSA_07235 [Pseudidiomarina salinarum]RUO71342.1 hypothetical protein CWI79_07920 [Pseudidiomarina salinarum]